MRGYTVKDIEARTIHSDGTIIPFNGKVEEKVIAQREGFKSTAKVFSLPDVEVGSIIEYRYRLEYYDHEVIAPTWAVQSELFTRKAHYLWRPTTNLVSTRDEKGAQMALSIGWLPVLPKDAVFTHDTLIGTGIHAGQAGQSVIELKIQNVPPLPQEPEMPPADSIRYRVRFYFTPYLTSEDFWKREGKRWSSARNDFIGPGLLVKGAAEQIAGPSGSGNPDDQRLRKLYAAVMQLDNTTFHSGPQTASAGPPGEPKTADDIWERKRGSDRQLTELFVAMARAVGFKAYLMAVTDRSRLEFVLNYLSLSQLEDYIAVVEVEGKEQFFDPGEPRCPYGQLYWPHTATWGLRQIEGGTKLVTTPDESYKEARTERVANLTLDQHGVASGTVKMTWIGVEATGWRQSALAGDSVSLRRELRTSMEKLLPAGMDVAVSNIQNLDEYEQPLIVTFDVKGPIGSATGKRLSLPGELFEVNSTPLFLHETRQTPVYFQHPSRVTDAIRIAFPVSFSVEATPGPLSVPFQKSAVYNSSTESTPTSITIRRDFVMGGLIYPIAEYTDLRAFYGKLETKDQEPVVLKAAASAPAGN
jgi:hypothetical protein